MRTWPCPKGVPLQGGSTVIPIYSVASIFNYTSLVPILRSLIAIINDISLTLYNTSVLYRPFQPYLTVTVISLISLM